MDTTKLNTEASRSGLAATNRAGRHAWEAEAIAAAQASANAGDLIDETEIDNWIDRLRCEYERDPQQPKP